MAINILWTSWRHIHESGLGLLDTALPSEELARVTEVLASYERRGIAFHALRTRRAGSRRFVSLHMFVQGEWSILRGHDLVEHVEASIHAALPDTPVFTHLEPREDPVAWDDIDLDRRAPHSKEREPQERDQPARADVSRRQEDDEDTHPVTREPVGPAVVCTAIQLLRTLLRTVPPWCLTAQWLWLPRYCHRIRNLG